MFKRWVGVAMGVLLTIKVIYFLNLIDIRTFRFTEMFETYFDSHEQ